MTHPINQEEEGPMTELAIRFTNEDDDAAPVHHLFGKPEEEVEEEPVLIQSQPAGPLPTFERATVAQTEIKISGAVAIDTHGEMTVALDDLVRAVGVFRVVRVNHYVNKHGDVVRQQVLAPVNDLEVVPFDPAAGDTGVISARP